MEKSVWMNKDYVQKVLQKSENDASIQVTSTIANSATTKGDNYMSDIYRINVKLSRIHNGYKIRETKSIIAKVVPQGSAFTEMILNGGYYETEFSVMTESLPKMNQILAGLNVTPLAARCLHVQYDEPRHLIIEDLTPEGYLMADRQAGLDLDHCLLVMKKLAAFHASSVALAEKDTKKLREYHKALFNKDSPAWICQFYDNGAHALGMEIAQWNEISPRISEKLLKLSQVFHEKGSDSAIFRQNDFNVLNHGDLWVNNVMFRYDENQKPVDLRFVDFQVSYYGSPAMDLLYFLSTSLCDDLRMLNREFLLREYHTVLTDTMNRLKCVTKAPSFDGLKKILQGRGFFEVVTTCVILPLILVDKNEHKTCDEIMKPDGTYDNPGHRNKHYRKVITRLLPIYDSMGLLDL